MGMMINRRRAYGGKRGLLPSGYRQLEYIESTGTQYINTRITNMYCDTYKVKTKYNYTSNSANSLCGGIPSDYRTTSSFGQIYLNVDNSSCVYSGKENLKRVIFNNIATNTDYEDEFTIDCTLGTITRTLNGTTLNGSGLDFKFRTSLPCCLYCRNDSYGPVQFGSEKIYYFQIYKDDVLVLNFIPARRVSDNALGMYDTVSEQFFTNAGTGSFIAGPEV